MPGLGIQVGRFVSAGAINTVLSFLLYQFLLLIMPYGVAYTFAFAAGIAFAAVAHSRLVFNVGLGIAAGIRFSLFFVASYAIGLELMGLLIHGLGIAESMAPLIVIPIMLPINFLGSRFALGVALPDARDCQRD